MAAPGAVGDVAVPAGLDVWHGIVGQDLAIRQLEAAAEPVHAYLLVGPPGAGKRELARGFAALLLSAGSTGPDAERHVRLALGEQHPDLRVVVPEGMTFRRIDAENLARHAVLAPVEGSRKVVVGLGLRVDGGRGRRLPAQVRRGAARRRPCSC